jgi:pyruvate dehydrogenase E1 component
VSAERAEIIQRIAHRVFVQATKMIYDANHRADIQEGDPKVGGHPAACSSCVHILSTLHLGLRRPQDLFAIKPHASPVDHTINHLLGLLHEPRGRRWLDDTESKGAMGRLRKFSEAGEPVFQSYHSEWDPDGDYFFPSGSVGIPPVVSCYTALAYRYATDHGLEVPKDAHFWSMVGDSEFREGSLMEAMPDAAERELGNVTWIVDYNRQNLDGTRIPNNRGLRGTDADRMERIAKANGWDIIQVRHGRKRLEQFKAPGGPALRDALEHGFSDYAFQALLLTRDGAVIREQLHALDKRLEKVLKPLSDPELEVVFSDLGGHDCAVLLDAFNEARSTELRPTLIVAHTVKGWGLECYAAQGNHSALPDDKEVTALLASERLDPVDAFARFDPASDEGQFLAKKSAELRRGVEEIWSLKDRNLALAMHRNNEGGGFPETIGLDLKYLPLVHTQYVWGQLAARLIRIGNRQEDHRRNDGTGEPPKPLTEEERRWGPAAELILTMAPDVGTSTNINPAMDDRIYGPESEQAWEQDLGVQDPRRPVLTPREDAWTRHIRFEIAEANCMSAVGAFGKLRDRLGIPFFPVMTIYDFFIKRAFDQLYYNLYWESGFVVVATPSGTTLAPEGAQHSWKSDIQMPNLITWEPFYALEVDWILAESVRRHYLGQDKGRTGVIIRAVTRAFRQAEMLVRLKTARRFGGRSDAEILESTRQDALRGGYYLVDHRGADGYEPGENVVNIFSMGAMGSEALAASDRLLGEGIHANVIVVTSADLLCGNLAHEDGYRHLREGLGITGDLFLRPERARASGNGGPVLDRADLVAVAGRRVPAVAVVDGEPGLLDSIGGIIGVRSETLGLRKASKSGRPIDVYRYLHVDRDSVYEACGRVLSETALEDARVSPELLRGVAERPKRDGSPATLWPPRQ